MSERILYIDTTGEILKLGVSVDGQMAASFAEQSTSHRYHSAIIIPTITTVLKEAGLAPPDLTAIAVNPGPGSFTGVRTGVSTARTLAQFLNIPVHLINTFELVAQIAEHGKSVTVVVDALRDRLYTASLNLKDGRPAYTEEPAMRMRGDWSSPEGGWWVSPSLVEAYPAAQVIPLDSPSSEAMQALIAQADGFYARKWPDVKPLYLQEPNITVKKERSGRT